MRKFTNMPPTLLTRPLDAATLCLVTSMLRTVRDGDQQFLVINGLVSHCPAKKGKKRERESRRSSYMQHCETRGRMYLVQCAAGRRAGVLWLASPGPDDAAAQFSQRVRPRTSLCRPWSLGRDSAKVDS